MRLLLDTHVFLWAAIQPDKLSSAVRDAIREPENGLCLSAISAYEVANKHRIGKLQRFEIIVEAYQEMAETLGIIDVPISTQHAYSAARLVWEHRDPFDRILAAQAMAENLTLVTSDKVFAELPQLKILW